MTKPQRKVDWEAIGLDYCSGGKLGEIARKYGVATPSILSKAKKEGWSPGETRKAGSGAARVRPVKSAPRRRGSKYAMRRMIGLVNRLTDELTQHLDQTTETDQAAPGGNAQASTPPTDQKFAADIVTSLTRTLEKLTQLEREANRQSADGREQAKTAGANDASTGTSTDTWDELQRRLARLAAGKSED